VQRQKIILIIGIVLALVSAVMVKIYIDQQVRLKNEQVRKNAQQQLEQRLANQAAVLVAKQDIARGTVIDAEMLETAVVPNQYVQPYAVTSLDRIAGMITVAPISKGEQIVSTKLTQQREAGAVGGLAAATPIGKRAITISVDNIAAVAGMIRPGDYVDVITSIPVPVQTPDGKQAMQEAKIPLFQNILVLAVGQQTGTVVSAEASRYKKEEEKAEAASPLITLALSPQEANLLAFVSEQGKIRLVLRSPADSKTEPIQPASWQTLFQYLAPSQEAAKPEVEEAKPESQYIEIYRGLNKEKILLSK
jgi:pilus assembly protein CpaB